MQATQQHGAPGRARHTQEYKMSHPKTRAELLAQTRAERDGLLAYLAGLSADDAARPGAYGWSARDHVAHLTDWEELLFGWYEAGLRGEKPALPAPGYTWKTLDALNENLRQRHLGESVEAATAAWSKSSARLIELIERLSEDDLFARGRFAWTGGKLAGYVFECGPNHYRWAAAEIKKGLAGG
jgi:hypothetical protein